MNIFIFLLIIALVAALFYFVGFKPGENQLNETIQEGTSVKVVFPSDADISLFGVEGIEDIIAGNCISEGLEKTLIDLSCPVECPLCEEPPEGCLDCVCETESVNVIYYQCLGGDFVEDKLDCS